MIILAVDGYWRTGADPSILMKYLQDKQERNFLRKWPEPVSEDLPVEHVREIKENTEGDKTAQVVDCRDCKYCFCGCGEDIVCGHPKSYAETSFGRGVNYARQDGHFCGPEGKLFEPRPVCPPHDYSYAVHPSGMCRKCGAFD